MTTKSLDTAEVVEFTITPESLDNVKSTQIKVPPFKITGNLHRSNCLINLPFTGDVTIASSAQPIKSIELQLVRVESVSKALVSGGAAGPKEYIVERTEIESLQVRRAASEACRTQERTIGGRGRAVASSRAGRPVNEHAVSERVALNELREDAKAHGCVQDLFVTPSSTVWLKSSHAPLGISVPPSHLRFLTFALLDEQRRRDSQPPRASVHDSPPRLHLPEPEHGSVQGRVRDERPGRFQ